VIRKAVRRTIFFIYLLLVLAATLAPLSGDMYVAVSGFDKLVHLGLFAGLAFLLYWSRKGEGEPIPTSAVVFSAALAGLIEIVQSPLRYRSGDWEDFVAGSVGAILGGTLALLAATLKHRMSRQQAS